MTSGVAGVLRRRLTESPPRGVISVYLFGSHAVGRAHRESDVDVGVLFRWDAYPTAADRFEARLRLAGQLAAATGPGDLDVVVLNDAPPSLGARIVTGGELVFRGDAPADHAFRRDVQLRAADLAPFLRRMARLKLASLRR
jgi:predicted nucleotidyltransferase